MRSIQYLLSSAAACAAVLLLPLAANALSVGKRTDLVLLHIPAKDVNDFKSFIAQTLDQGQAETPAEWRSSARTSRQAVKVVLTPSAVVQTSSAGQCRHLAAQVSQRQDHESWKVLFCRQDGGSWKISGLE